MSLLAIDTATRAMGLAIYDGHQVLFERIWQSDNYHTVDLAPAIVQAFDHSRLSLKKIKAIAIAIGPGSYTGLRIGLAFAKGLAFPKRLPILTVSTLDILAAGQPLQELPMLAIIRAGRGRLALASYRVEDSAWKATGDPQLTTIQELSDSLKTPTLICGELEKADRKVLERKRKNAILAAPAWNVRRPAMLAEMAWQRFQAGESEPALGLAPKYLETPQAIPE